MSFSTSCLLELLDLLSFGDFNMYGCATKWYHPDQSFTFHAVFQNGRRKPEVAVL
jgi:hypothetical protein